MPISTNYHTLTKFKEGKSVRKVIVTYISDKEEKDIDNGVNFLTLERGDKTFYISLKDILTYGNVDFTNKDDLSQLNKIKLFKDTLNCVYRYSNYDYTTHTCKSDIRIPKWTEVIDTVDLVKYAHGCLNKPDRIIIFKYVEK